MSAQSKKAMELYHSGKVSSLKEAWAEVKAKSSKSKSKSKAKVAAAPKAKKAKRKASPLARKAATLRSASCKVPLKDAWKKARAAKPKVKGRALAKRAMSTYSASCSLPMADAWKAAKAASKGRTPRPSKRNPNYDYDFSRELSMFDYHHPSYEQTVGQFGPSEAFTHGIQPANRRNPRKARANKGYDTDFSQEISLFDFPPPFISAYGPFGVSEAFTHGLQPVNRRNPRKARKNKSRR